MVRLNKLTFILFLVCFSLLYESTNDQDIGVHGKLMRTKKYAFHDGL